MAPTFFTFFRPWAGAWSLLVIRVAFGAELAHRHGLGKLQSWLAGSTSFPDPLHIGARASLTGAVLGEFLCGILLAIGLATRVAAAGIAFTMGTILFVMGWGKNPLGNELAWLYFAVGVAVAISGGGQLSLDTIVGSKMNILRRGMRRSGIEESASPRS